MPTLEHHDNLDYGDERHIYIDGKRYRTGVTRTIRPHVAETNGDFACRMDQLAQALHRMNSVQAVGTKLIRRDGAIVECVVDIEYTAQPDPVRADGRPAGGRVVDAGRGVRGGR